jgi:hypothetical protein
VRPSRWAIHPARPAGSSRFQWEAWRSPTSAKDSVPWLHTGPGNFTVPITRAPGRYDSQPRLNEVRTTGHRNASFAPGWSLEMTGDSRHRSEGAPSYAASPRTVAPGDQRSKFATRSLHRGSFRASSAGCPWAAVAPSGTPSYAAPSPPDTARSLRPGLASRRTAPELQLAIAGDLPRQGQRQNLRIRGRGNR